MIFALPLQLHVAKLIMSLQDSLECCKPRKPIKERKGSLSGSIEHLKLQEAVVIRLQAVKQRQCPNLHQRSVFRLSNQVRPPHASEVPYGSDRELTYFFRLDLRGRGYNVSVNDKDQENGRWIVLVAKQVPGGKPQNVINCTYYSIEEVIEALRTI